MARPPVDVPAERALRDPPHRGAGGRRHPGVRREFGGDPHGGVPRAHDEDARALERPGRTVVGDLVPGRVAVPAARDVTGGAVREGVAG
ncbi:hypothetical protein [Streptomyces triticirhizae]|uniref:hypothetical protein n=1 Tax=Streptomyces triticirhizae TaxID=2483353 RepID=UPI001315694B|nr:hypothetical protein [Streptomyces triticirhizae]